MILRFFTLAVVAVALASCQSPTSGTKSSGSSSVTVTGYVLAMLDGYNGSTSGIDVYALQSNGTLVLQSGSGISSSGQVYTGTNQTGLVVTPDGRYAFVADYGNNRIESFSIGAEGKLTHLDGVDADYPAGLAVSPSGEFLLAVSGDRGANYVKSFSIDSTGALTEVDEVSLGTDTYAASDLYFAPDGAVATTLDANGQRILQVLVGSDGALSLGDPVPVGVSVQSLVYNPAGTRAWSTQDDGSILAYTVNNGLLTRDQDHDAAAPAANLEDGLSTLAVNPAGTELSLVSDNSDQVFFWSIGSDGALVAKTPFVLASDGTAPGVVLTYASNGTQAVVIRSEGLTSLGKTDGTWAQKGTVTEKVYSNVALVSGE